ncbi:outer membrane lipid asymmetry maintenance protein MlaD [Mangrovicoccus sp. HB161399]|uniref:outer membrane lipid asymmetry maintenance protein MlaD n=1 Tax=Mangrovicoccus sp. HB161399 TaxID=2720392 RepID=UPI001553E7C6|nr:outer membrane lipid asymmetry maintenance protein MlaD [Mangrovicoccus sp. HB161399]
MSENVTEVAVGGAVLAVAAAFLFYALGSAGSIGSTAGYPLTASFRSAEGIGVGTDVRMAGVKIGSVTGMDLNAQTFRAEATVQINNGIELPDDSAIVISSEGLLGGNFVEVLPGGSAYNYKSGDEVLDTQGAVSLISLLMKFVGGGE